jgi:hypothetical protein
LTPERLLTSLIAEFFCACTKINIFPETFMSEKDFCFYLCKAASFFRFKILREDTRFVFIDPFGPLVIGNQSSDASLENNLYHACVALQEHLNQ